MITLLFISLSDFYFIHLGPRPKRLLRRGKWRKESLKVSKNWKFSEDLESHEISEGFLKNGFTLTGESAGRQIWYQSQEDINNSNTSSTSQFEFNPSKNPNSSDLLFRDFMTKKWLNFFFFFFHTFNSNSY